MESPYLEDGFAPTSDEHSGVALRLIEGEVPRDLHGAYVRNGPNPRFEQPGRYHWFDGDGMLHAVRFGEGTATYTNRYVHTADFARETEADAALFRGLMESSLDNPAGRYKDTGNTDVLVHNGELLTLHYMGASAWRVDPITLETLGKREVPAKLSAHAKVDPATGELLHFDYAVEEPFLRFGSLAPDGTHTWIDTPVAEPVYPHDMAFTPTYAILMEPPVTLSAKHHKAGRWGVVEHRDRPFRFHLVPRHGGAPRSFEATGCYLYHVVDAWEEGDTVELVGFRCPRLFPKPDPSEGANAVMMANLRLRATLHRWRFNLTTGETHEEALDDRNAEFPTIDSRQAGQGASHGYAMSIPTDTSRLRFDGVIKYDVKTGAARTEKKYGTHRYANEVAFGPRTNSNKDDDGYLVTFVFDEQEGRSEVVVWDAANLDTVCRLEVPVRVPLGFHACWYSEGA